MLDSSSPNLLRGVNGVKRLLPAIELSSSPPRFKRQKSRTATVLEDENRYPTPIPSSSLGTLPSSPPAAAAVSARRPPLKRTQSTVSERAPLSAVPSITLPKNGETILLGRSSNSSHYRLSANRLISRVHIKATYHAVTQTTKPKIEIKCIGWNGVKVHCQGRAWDLQKDDVFVSETEYAEIMLDVHDSRVVIAWPGAPASRGDRENNLTSSPSTLGPPTGRVNRSPSVDWEAGNDENADPWDNARRINGRAKLTPVSPTPRRVNNNSMINRRQSVSQSAMAETFLDIYEDEPEGAQELPPVNPNAANEVDNKPASHPETEAPTEAIHPPSEFDAEIPLAPPAELEADDEEEEPRTDADQTLIADAQVNLEFHASEPSDSEADDDDESLLPPPLRASALSSTLDEPLTETAEPRSDFPLHSFVPHSDLPPFQTAFPPSTPPSAFARGRSSSPLSAAPSPQQNQTKMSPSKYITLQNHLTNQLAFSRVNTMPLSELYENLPGTLAVKTTKEMVGEILRDTKWVGEIKRTGKDAAGKELESQWYYVLEDDEDEGRRSAVGGRAGVRNCRKTHKQYYWKKPKKISY
ncbi:Similar to Protein TOS4; acc. no. Q06266 [Pyronema omphalodes CBS 100304]|uniref:Similar to Protein TOS4 acc. no. Q06266 n=1 Tax=Pyronema omphalodes (strain CBS 100304) TaxID=1076935 RepID=U4LEI8_PYROM|nr:Similar to Protein TOS4; acc. no. Q06266 [Pyronema omphalodes CBS 100304]